MPQNLRMTTPFVDIHTHCEVSPTASQPICVLQSYGVHPWWLDDHPEPAFIDCQLHLLKTMLDDHRLAAIGETGLDKLHPLTYQQQLLAFSRHIELSEQYHKPLVIHNVKSTSDILKLHKQHKPKQLWILHGFNGNHDEVQQLVAHGLCLSLGEGIFHENRKIVSSIKSIPLDHLFLETDTGPYSIEEVYQRAAELIGITLEGLKDHLFNTFTRRVGLSAGLLSFEGSNSLESMNTASPTVLLTAPVLGSLIDQGNSNERLR